MSADQVGADQLYDAILKPQEILRVGRLSARGRRAGVVEETPGPERWTTTPARRRAVLTLEALEIPAPLLRDRGPVPKELTVEILDEREIRGIRDHGGAGHRLP